MIKEPLPELPQGFSSFITYSELGGSPTPISTIQQGLVKLPLDGVLGFLAHLSLDIAREGIKITDPRWQAPYLNMALVDDFPESLQNLSRCLAPGRVPITGGLHVFIHNQNIAVLAQLGILNCDEQTLSPQLTYELRRRVCRLLLLAGC